MRIVVATPLEPELVDRIRHVVPGAEVSFEPALLPPPRYPSDHRGDPEFRRDQVGQRRFDELLAGADVLLGVPGETPEALAHVVRTCSRLRWVQGNTAGMGEMVRRAGLTREELDRVRFTSTAGVHGAQLAEWAMLGLLAFTKDLPRLLADKADRRWRSYVVRELRGQTLLVLGLGGIGREVARLARCLGMRVVGVRRAGQRESVGGSPPDVDTVEEVHPPSALPELVGRADAVVLALPGTPETAGLFSRALIERLPHHAVVVNVGRGAAVDETALTEALAAGRIAGAALDVFATEPLPPDSPLWELPNVLISPHTASVTPAENGRVVELFCDNLQRWVGHQPLRNLVDTEHFY
ncbi:MAG TPA: D-2-hydroxyacid dehydrogenase [Actinomycetes bacterium]|nr:D-2-hydroxyacid dehydrogenase [Actinomycetes bacterium]